MSEGSLYRDPTPLSSAASTEKLIRNGTERLTSPSAGRDSFVQ